MEPEDIERHDFFVGLRGYDRDEVNQFLAEVAAELRATRAEVDLLRNRPETTDPFEHLGSNVTAILRTANDTADGILASANEEAEAIRVRAESAAEHVRSEADAYAGRVRDEVAAETDVQRRAIDDARGEASRIADEARGELELRRLEAESQAAALVADAETRVAAMAADAEGRAAHLIAEAEERARTIEDEAERTGRDRAVAAVDQLVGRVQDALRQQEAVRSRLAEASDEVQLALMALGQPVGDPAQFVRDATIEIIDLEHPVASE